MPHIAVPIAPGVASCLAAGPAQRNVPPMACIAHLPARAVIEVAGPDRVSFLQGLVSNDVALAAPGRAVWAALLTPQGKWLADFFILADGERLLLDCDRAQVTMLLPRLSRYRLRAQVTLREAAELSVHVAWDGTPEAPGSVAAADPRLPDAGWRILAAEALPVTADADAWDAHRIALGLPDAADMESEKTTLLEAGFDELGGVSWTKGCYMGQELTARTKYRGLLKRRLMPVALSGDATSGSPVSRDGAEVGVLRSVAGMQGLALLRLDALEGRLMAGNAEVTPRPAAWMRLPEPA